MNKAESTRSTLNLQVENAGTQHGACHLWAQSADVSCINSPGLTEAEEWRNGP